MAVGNVFKGLDAVDKHLDGVEDRDLLAIKERLATVDEMRQAPEWSAFVSRGRA
jgi:hypothetical protein